MYSKVIEHENILQKLNEENEELRKKLELLEKENNTFDLDYNNNQDSNCLTYENGIDNTLNLIKNKEKINTEFKCDYDIFKKIQEKMNKKTAILEKTIKKYELKPAEKTNKNNKDNNNSINTFDLFKESSNNNLINDNKNQDEYFTSSSPNLYESLIFKIPSILLDNKLEEIEVYIRLETIYEKLTSITSKLDFISLLKQVLNNIIMLKHASMPIFMQLFNFILNLEVNELNLNELNPSLPCSYIQSLLEFLIVNKEITDMIKILIILIKRYMPTNFKLILDNKNLISLKLLLFYLKKINDLIPSSNARVKEICIEINDFLYTCPPSCLKKDLPLCDFYLEIFKEIRNTTNLIIKNCKSKSELSNTISFIKSKLSTVSKDYVKYLEYIIYKC